MFVFLVILYSQVNNSYLDTGLNRPLVGPTVARITQITFIKIKGYGAVVVIYQHKADMRVDE
jgi:hypothetical protein